MDSVPPAPSQAKGPCHDFLNRPLGGFALMGAWVGCIEVLCCACAFQNEDLLDKCNMPEGYPTDVGIWGWLAVSCGGALMHVLLAPYIHLQLWRRLVGEAKEADDPDKGPSGRTLEARRQGGAIRASKHDILEAFKDTFQQDPVVYLYALILLGDLVWSVLGLFWIQGKGPSCDPSHWTRRTAYSSIFFFCFVKAYGIAWYFYMKSMDMADTMTLRSGSASDGYHELDQAAAITEHACSEEEEQTKRSFLNCCVSCASGKSKPQVVAPVKPPDPPPKNKHSVAWAMPKLGACLLLDAMGNVTYFAPGVGELGDTVFAPASAVMVKMLFNRNGIAAANGLEEILPYTDVMPTATLAWALENLMPDSRITRMFGLNRE